MPCSVVVETVTYPDWWDTATTVEVATWFRQSGSALTYSPSDLEFLPQGLHVVSASTLWPWARIDHIKKVS